MTQLVTTLQAALDGGGNAAKRLLQNDFNVDCLRPCVDISETDPSQINVNATLRRDEWKQFDDKVMQIARERLNVTQYLISKGLVYNLPNALGVMSLEWEQMKGDLVDAEVTMSGLSEATKDRLEWGTDSLPVPLFHKEFFYNLRHLEAGRRNGNPIDTAHATEATRKISELIEKVIFTGLTIGNKTIYGLTSHPGRATVSVTASWALAGTSGASIVGDVRAMIDEAALPPNNMEGPYVLFVPRGLSSKLQEDYKAESDDTILERIRRVEGIQDVIFTNRLTGTNVLLVQLSSDVIEIVNGLAPTMVEWDSHGGFQHNFKIFGIMIPRIRVNGDGQTGIVHAS